MSDAFDSTEITNEMALESTQVGQAGKPPRWHTVVAVSTPVMALFTAVGALLAGITAHDALLDKTTELMDTTIAENDRVSIEVLKAKVEILSELGESPDPMDIAMIEAYETEVTAFEEAAAFEESGVQTVSATYLILAVAVTTFSVGITLSGMAIIVIQKVSRLFTGEHVVKISRITMAECVFKANDLAGNDDAIQRYASQMVQQIEEAMAQQV